MNSDDYVRQRLEGWLTRRQGFDTDGAEGFRAAGGDASKSAAGTSAPQMRMPTTGGGDRMDTMIGTTEAIAGITRLIDAMPDPAMLIDVAGVILHCNTGVIDLFPRVRAGQQLSQATRAPELLTAIDSVLDTNERAVVQLVDRVPVKRRISAIVTRVSAEAEAVGALALLITFRDLTDQERHNQMRADFIANASHELRTPLASLRGFIETLQGPARNDSAAQDRFIAMMANEASRMSRLIDDLLTLSRVEMRAHLPPRGIVDLKELAEFVAVTLEPLAETDEIRLEVKAEAGSADVRGDREELIQVLQNLVHNAIKYGRRGGRVEIRIAALAAVGNRQRLAISVSDDGVGIAEHHLPRLTERFYRVSTAASRARGGTGLGLAIVKHIVSRHRGELEITSMVGEGSTFRIIFDAAPQGDTKIATSWK